MHTVDPKSMTQRPSPSFQMSRIASSGAWRAAKAPLPPLVPPPSALTSLQLPPRLLRRLRPGPARPLPALTPLSRVSAIARASTGDPAGALRPYFTNADRMKEDDPYAALGLEWGATSAEIREAYRMRARSLHPDVNRTDSPEAALRKFQRLQRAYASLMKRRGDGRRGEDDAAEGWSFAVWRDADRIAEGRTDVAGLARRRPARPAAVGTGSNRWGVAPLGHPDGRGVGAAARRAEYLAGGSDGDAGSGSGSGSGRGRRSGTVGTGRSKWVETKEFKPWNPGKGGSGAGRAGWNHWGDRKGSDS